MIDAEVIDGEYDTFLLREAALKQPDDPHRVVLTAAAKLLASNDWRGLLTPTDDFVVYVAEHDEGWGPKLESVLTINPPERIAKWKARWPPNVTSRSTHH